MRTLTGRSSLMRVLACGAQPVWLAHDSAIATTAPAGALFHVLVVRAQAGVALMTRARRIVCLSRNRDGPAGDCDARKGSPLW